MRKWEIGVLVGLSILVSLVYYFPILNSGNNLGIQDWDQNFAWTEASRVSLLDFHQFPLWNPYKCGGSVQFGNPQIPVISIQTVFALLFGTIRGIKLSIFFHGVIGFIGFYILAKQNKLSTLGSLLASTIFSFSGITGSFLSTGMVVFTCFAYMPYILFFYNKSLIEGKWGIVCGVLFALSFYAGYHILLLLGFYIVIYSLVTSIVKRTFAPCKALALLAFIAAILVFPKLILSIQLIRTFPRLTYDVSGYSLRNFFYFLLSPKQDLFNAANTTGAFFGVDENSLYVGLISVVMFLLFFILNKKAIKNNLVLLLTMLVVFWLMLGSSVTPSLYKLIRLFPVISSFRAAERFRFVLIIPFALIAGLGLDNLGRLLKKHQWIQSLSIIFLLVVFADLTLFSSRSFLSKTLIIKNPESQLSRSGSFTQTALTIPDLGLQRTISLPGEWLESRTFTPWSYEYLFIKQNNGVLKCYDSITSTVNAVGVEDPKYQGEFTLLNPVEGVSVENTFWSPDKLVYQITNAEKAVNHIIIVNQNYYPGWIVKTKDQPCRRAIHSSGLLATKLVSSTDTITFEFNPFLRWFVCRN